VPRTDRANATTYWLDRRTPGLSLLTADLTTHDYPTHVHEALLVAATEAGGSEIEAAGVPDEAHGEALLVVNPAEPHASRMRRSRGWRYRSFYLTESAMAAVCEALGIVRLPPIDQGMIRAPDLVGAFLRLHRALEAGADALRQRELLVTAFGELVRRHGGGRLPAGPPPRDRALLDRALATMRERHAERLTLDDLALAAGLTPFQLIGLFRRGVGMTPHAYLTQVRLGIACHHLRRGAAIAEAAAAAGFYDQSALTNHFRRSYGMTPLQYVRAVRNFGQYPAWRGAARCPERCEGPSITNSPTPWS
jgi:AraC-like DNA-binding protein